MVMGASGVEKSGSATTLHEADLAVKKECYKGRYHTPWLITCRVIEVDIPVTVLLLHVIGDPTGSRGPHYS
jgi:hypothetical protein